MNGRPLSPAQAKLLAELRRRHAKGDLSFGGEVALSHWDNRRTVRALEARGFLKQFGDNVELSPKEG